MAEFQTVIKECERMCDNFRTCVSCPLGKAQKDSVSCKDWIFRNPAEAEQIIMKWAAENPPKTNGDKFREVFGYDFVQAVYADDWYNAEYKEPEEQEELT